MVEYIFVLGRNTELSILELVSYLKKEGFSAEIKSIDRMIPLELQGFKEQKAIAHLGGVMKIGKEITNENEIYTGTKNKINFAINHYKSDPLQAEQKLAKMFAALDVKAMHKFVKSKIIIPQKTKHLDVEVIAYREKLYLVVATSNPKSYGQRDESRPAFDALRAISIRLAKILINLAQPKKEVFDPFCGTGTILQEALLMGYKAKGSDKQVQDARKNLSWLEKQYPAAKGEWQITHADATKLSQTIQAVECVVTEPYLGPFFKRPPAYAEAQKITSQLEILYLKTLQELRKIVTGKIVILFPAFLTRERKKIQPDINVILQKAGFKISSPTGLISLPLRYDEKRNNVERYLYVLEKR
ncbi:MAG: hypothetical protein AABW64_04450 [Nanoarchaeota archaeon]